MRLVPECFITALRDKLILFVCILCSRARAHARLETDASISASPARAAPAQSKGSNRCKPLPSLSPPEDTDRKAVYRFCVRVGNGIQGSCHVLDNTQDFARILQTDHISFGYFQYLDRFTLAMRTTRTRFCTDLQNCN